MHSGLQAGDVPKWDGKQGIDTDTIDFFVLVVGASGVGITEVSVYFHRLWWWKGRDWIASEACIAGAYRIMVSDRTLSIVAT